jgi:2-succinyl-5-enolpyruvyl-6-hydroxy-3-cyclohexene-1-carboxylate synthase
MPDMSLSLAEPQNPTYAYVGAFVDELRRNGLRHAVICPGSRSTPLALVLASVPTIRCWMHVDERSAAFFALGLAKRLGQPVALLCTSGTAAANFLPAIAEAHLTHIPLLVLTADRPPELRDSGAPQAIDQNRLYGTHAKWFMETALPEASNDALRYIRTIACRALAQTQVIPAGPIHLNMPFREPLTPAPLPNQPLPPENTRDPLAWQGRPDDQPYVQVASALQNGTTEGKHSQLITAIGNSPRGLILAGPQTDPALAGAMLQLARKTGYPILADPLSQLRGRMNESELVISSYDAFLRSERFLARYEPQLILRFGAMPTSKPLLLYLNRYAGCMQIVINAQQSWEEPTQLATQLFYTDAKDFCVELGDALDSPDESGTKECGSITRNRPLQQELVAWTKAWQAAEWTTRQALNTALADFPALFEGRVFSELAELLPARSLLYAGNSMPIRDMDTFFWPRSTEIRCLGNRGANGIDGVISSALGASAAGVPNEPAVLVIGDLSFFHDLNGLLAARLHHLHLTIVLVNNDGGGIFSFLPQSTYPEHFEQLFGTATGLDFRPVVEMYGGSFRRIVSWEEFRQTLQHDLNADGLHVIEVPTERASNVTMHRQLWQVMEQALEQANLLAKKGEA